MPPASSGFPDHDAHTFPLLSSPAAGAAAPDQQQCHQKQQRPHGEDGGDQDPGPKATAHTPIISSLLRETYGSPLSLFPGMRRHGRSEGQLPGEEALHGGKQNAPGAVRSGRVRHFFFSCQALRGLSSSYSRSSSDGGWAGSSPPPGPPARRSRLLGVAAPGEAAPVQVGAELTKVSAGAPSTPGSAPPSQRRRNPGNPPPPPRT